MWARCCTAIWNKRPSLRVKTGRLHGSCSCKVHYGYRCLRHRIEAGSWSFDCTLFDLLCPLRCCCCFSASLLFSRKKLTHATLQMHTHRAMKWSVHRQKSNYLKLDNQFQFIPYIDELLSQFQLLKWKREFAASFFCLFYQLKNNFILFILLFWAIC